MSLFQKMIVIPARYGSQRFPGKMLAKILGKPLIQHTFENAKRCETIHDIFIATDDQRILNAAKRFQAEAIMTPKETPNGTTRAYLALKQLANISKDAIIINLQGDEPILSPGAIDRLSTLLEKNPEIKMATLARPIQDPRLINDPSIVKCVFDQNFNALYFSRAPIPFSKSQKMGYQHIGIYAFRYDFLEKYCKLKPSILQKAEDLEQLKVLENGYKIRVLVDESFAIGVDHPQDLEKVEKHLCQ